jgi:hypothetical protein
MGQTAKKKEELLTVRMQARTHSEFKVVAELRGLSMSALVHSYAVKVIREEKDRDLAAFESELERQRQEAETEHKDNGTGPVLRFKKPAKKPTIRAKSKRKLSG